MALQHVILGRCCYSTRVISVAAFSKLSFHKPVLPLLVSNDRKCSSSKGCRLPISAAGLTGIQVLPYYQRGRSLGKFAPPMATPIIVITNPGPSIGTAGWDQFLNSTLIIHLGHNLRLLPCMSACSLSQT